MPRHIRIVGNTFTNSTRCTPDPYHAGSAISLEGVIASAVVGPNPAPFGSVAEPFVRVAYRGVSGITIVNNRFNGFCRGSAVLLGEAVNTSVRNNTIGGPPDVVAAAIKVADSRAILIEDNNLLGWKEMAEAIQVQANSTKAVTTAGNRIIAAGLIN